MNNEIPLQEEVDRFLSKLRTKEGVEVDHQAWANSKAAQKQLADAFDQDLALVGFGRAVRYRFQNQDLAGGYHFPPASELLGLDAPIVDLHTEDWITELRKGSGYWLVENGFEGSTDSDHANPICDSFSRYLELGLERWFVNYWPRPETMLSCGLTVEQAAQKVAEQPYQKAFTVHVLAHDEVAAGDVVAWLVRSCSEGIRGKLAKALACGESEAELIARIETGKKLQAKKLLNILDAPQAVPRTAQGIKDYFGVSAAEPHVDVHLRIESSREGVYPLLRLAVDALAQGPGGEALAAVIDAGMRWGRAYTGYVPLTAEIEDKSDMIEGKILLPRRLIPTGCIAGASWNAIAGH